MSLLEAPARDFPTRGGAALAPAPDQQVAPHLAPKTDARHLRVVAPSERVRRRLTPAMGVVLTGLLFAMLFAIAIAHTLLVQGQVRLDGIDEKLTVEQARYQQLRNEVAGMESPARVVAAAQALGMVAPDDLVYLQPDAAVHSPNAGAGSTGSTSAPAGTDWSAMKPLLEAPAQ